MTGVTKKLFVCQMFMCLFWPLDITDPSFWGELSSNYRYRIVLPEEVVCISETDLWEFQQKVSHYRHRCSLEFQLNFYYRYRSRAQDEFMPQSCRLQNIRQSSPGKLLGKGNSYFLTRHAGFFFDPRMNLHYH